MCCVALSQNVVYSHFTLINYRNTFVIININLYMPFKFCKYFFFSQWEIYGKYSMCLATDRMSAAHMGIYCHSCAELEVLM